MAGPTDAASGLAALFMHPHPNELACFQLKEVSSTVMDDMSVNIIAGSQWDFFFFSI